MCTYHSKRKNVKCIIVKSVKTLDVKWTNKIKELNQNKVATLPYFLHSIQKILIERCTRTFPWSIGSLSAKLRPQLSIVLNYLNIPTILRLSWRKQYKRSDFTKNIQNLWITRKICGKGLNWTNLDKIGRQFGLFWQGLNPWYDWVLNQIPIFNKKSRKIL